MTEFRAPDPDVSRAIRSWLHEDRHEDASRLAGAVLDQVEATPRRRAAWWPARRTPIMNRIVTIGLGTAAVVLALAFGIQLLAPTGGGTGGQPTPTASAAPSQPFPSATPTARAASDEDLQPGTYFVRPLPAPNDSLTVTFTVPEGWSFGAGTLTPTGEPGTGAPGGIAIQFDDVTTLHDDACFWSETADDISVGPTVDDLIDALRAHQTLLAQTAYEVSAPVDVAIGGYRGKRVDVVHPTELFVGSSAMADACDEGRYRMWSTAVHDSAGVYVQGPANRWQVNAIDVDGSRLVIVVQDFPGTLPADRAELDAIIDSIVINP